MRCVFDGTYDGLMTLVFDTWNMKEALGEVSEWAGAESFLPERYFTFDEGKARRVKAYITGTLGPEFVFMAKEAFLSRRGSRFRSIVRTVHLSPSMGGKVLHLLDDDVLDFIACMRETRMEAHHFMGLLRFRQMRDGSLLAVFAPRNNVLTLVLPHFAERFPDERLLLYDEGRGLAGLSGQGRVEFVRAESLAPREAGNEAELQGLWRVFFNTLAIPERANPRLQRQHLPKYTWKNLTEMQ
jgi:probable DNA metabolism protein